MKGWIWALAVAALAGGNMDWKTAGVAGSYRCLIPQGWKAKPATMPAGAVRYGDGVLSVSVTRFKGQDQRFFLRSLPSPAPKPAGTAAVSGGKADLFERQYRFTTRGDESKGREEQWVYEQFALIPDTAGLWVLKFRSPSPEYEPKPEGLELWKKFLQNFRLEPVSP